MNLRFPWKSRNGLMALLTLTFCAAAAAQSPVRINEVMANNLTLTNVGGVLTDWVELVNPSPAAVDLSDASLTDTTISPRRFVFPSGSVIPANGRLMIRFNPLLAKSANNTGFGLKASGDRLYFYDSRANGSALIDSIEFGIQPADMSIGRIPDATGSWALTLPTPAAANVASPLGSASALRINEWMADRSNDNSDWFEIFNGDSAPVALAGLHLTDKLNNRTQFTIPGLSFIGAGPRGGYTIFYADGETGSGANHVNFKLGAGGDNIGLYSAALSPIDIVTFGLQQRNVSEGRLPDGSANRVFFTESQSPGAANRLLTALTDVIINEVLAHTDPPLEDAVELFNTTDAPIDIGGWYLSDDVNELTRYRIPDNTILPANGYVVIYEGQFNAAGLTNPTTPFTYNSSRGDEAFLAQPDASGTPIAFTRQEFPSSQNAFSFGRYVKSDGVDFVAMSARTFGQDNPRNVVQFRRGTGLPNATPLVGPLVINEIMYRPPDIGISDNSQDEFIELRNLTAQRLPLFDRRYTTNRWRLRDAVDFEFPANTWVEPNGILLVVKFDPATNSVQLEAFRLKYAVESSVPIFGPYTGELANNEESVELVKPDPVQLPPHPDAGYVPYILVDRVKYKDAAPWPPEADGTGLSLQRKNRRLYGNDAVNWIAAAPTAGRPNGTPPQLTLQPAGQIYIAGSDTSFTVAATGSEPLRFQWKFNGTDIPGATNPTLPLINLDRSDLGAYSAVVSNDEESVLSTTALLRADLKKPVLTVATPRPNIRVTSSAVTMRGTVRDDFGVSQVLVRLNDGEFQPAQGTTNWSMELTLAAGTNTIQAKALDLGLNESPTTTLRVFLVVPSTLTVVQAGSGSGSQKPALNGAILEVGRGYTITATPTTGSLFSNWVATSTSGSYARTEATLNFLMQPDLVLTANYVLNPFMAVRGAYNGLYFEQDEVRHHSSGFFTATVTDLGAFSASLQIGTKRFPFSGRFDLAGLTTNRVSLGGTNAVAVEMQLYLSGASDRITGRVVANSWISALTADRATFNARTNTAPFAGAHTLVIPGSNDAATSPGGDGFGNAAIGGNGSVNFAGMLGDGTKATQKTAVSRAGDWPFYIGLYGGKGSMLGWVAATNRTEDDLSGLLSWIKPAQPGKNYSAGFTNDTALTGSRYTPPGASRVLNFTNAFVTFTGGNLALPLTNAVTLGDDNKITNLSDNKLTLTISTANGSMSGSATDPATGKPISFKGVVLRKQQRAAGFFLGTNASGRVLLQAQ